MTGPIGYYVHHHGDGHRQRALGLARRAPERFVLLGAGLAGRVEGLNRLDLADDRADTGFEGRDGADERPLALHYAPYGHAGVRDRVAAVAAWITEVRPALMVIDVSVEMAMLARLAATPTVYVRLAGARSDAAHLDAFRGAVALMAPFAEPLDDPETPEWLRSKTRYFAGLAQPARPGSAPTSDVLVVIGQGGPAGDGQALATAAVATPDRHWTVIGRVKPSAARPPNLNLAGWVEDAADRIARARVVVGGAGDGLVNAVLAADRPFVCLPEPRPFDEQISKAARLDALGAAVVRPAWPEPSAWSAILAQAEGLAPAARRALHDPDGQARAAAFLIATADDPARCR